MSWRKDVLHAAEKSGTTVARDSEGFFKGLGTRIGRNDAKITASQGRSAGTYLLEHPGELEINIKESGVTIQTNRGELKAHPRTTREKGLSEHHEYTTPTAAREGAGEATRATFGTKKAFFGIGVGLIATGGVLSWGCTNQIPVTLTDVKKLTDTSIEVTYTLPSSVQSDVCTSVVNFFKPAEGDAVVFHDNPLSTLEDPYIDEVKSKTSLVIKFTNKWSLTKPTGGWGTMHISQTLVSALTNELASITSAILGAMESVTSGFMKYVWIALGVIGVIILLSLMIRWIGAR
jgi:hypothetical protein